jgi:hypothetical protein
MKQAKSPTDFLPRLLFDSRIRLPDVNSKDDGQLLDRVYATLGLPFNQHLAMDSCITQHQHQQQHQPHSSVSPMAVELPSDGVGPSITYTIVCELPVAVLKESDANLLALLARSDRFPPPPSRSGLEGSSGAGDRVLIEVHAGPHPMDPSRVDCKKVTFEPRKDLRLNFFENAPFDMQLSIETRHVSITVRYLF